MDRQDWDRLKPLQVGRYAKQLVEMEFSRWGFAVQQADVDVKRNYFHARLADDHVYDIQVKALRPKRTSYTFILEEQFDRRPTYLVAFVWLRVGAEPELFLIPSPAWPLPGEKNSRLLVHRPYDKPGQISKPEYGINVSARTRPLLEQFRFDRQIELLRESV
ncbi:hypothetical protein [Nocardia heshunensis]